MPGSTKVWSIT